MQDRKGGRAPDDAVAYYCHAKLRERLADGSVTQKAIAEAANLPASAINHLLQTGTGIGPSTAKRLAEYLGFPTRGAMIDAADEWWERGGFRYAIRFLKENNALKVAEKVERHQRTSRAALDERRKNPATHPEKKRRREKHQKTGT